MLVDLMGGLLTALLGQRMMRRRAKKLAVSGKTDCGLRLLIGAHPGLSARWRHGTAWLKPGEIQIDGATIHVREVDRSAARRPSGREVWSVSPRAVVVQVRTDAAVLEWAVLRERLDWAVEQVQPTRHISS